VLIRRPSTRDPRLDKDTGAQPLAVTEGPTRTALAPDFCRPSPCAHPDVPPPVARPLATVIFIDKGRLTASDCPKALAEYSKAVE